MVLRILFFSFVSILGGMPAAQAQLVTKDQVDAAKNAIDLRTYEATADLTVEKAAAEARKAIAEAQKAEAAAQVPATKTEALAGSIDSKSFGAAGLVKAFDLAQSLAQTVCKDLPATETYAIYDASHSAGVAQARLVRDEIQRITENLRKANASLEQAAKAPSQDMKMMGALVGIGVATGAIKAMADLASLFKTNISLASATYSDDPRALFASALAENCPSKITSLGGGYMGELDTTQYMALKKSVIELMDARYAFSDRISQVKRAAEKAKDAEKARLDALAAESSSALKQADAFIEALKPSDVSDKAPLYNAARFLALDERTSTSKVLDFSLRLDGLAITKENIFTGQKLRLSGVALFWYRLHNRDGSLISAQTLRRITQPVEVDFRSKNVKEADKDGFWYSGGSAAAD